VRAGSCGPGNLHLINGLYDAHRSGAPVLAIASHIPRTEIRRGYFPATHPDRLFVECSLYCELVSRPEPAPHLFRSAMQAASADRGVAVVTLPGDIAEEPATTRGYPLSLPTPSTLIPDEQAVQNLADAINRAGKVAVFAGFGARDAHDEVVEFA